MKVVAIAIAGAAGALARYGIDLWISARTRHPFPWGILVVNVIGCFLIGLVFAALTERFIRFEEWRVPLTAGFIGAFTTFSTFAFQTIDLLEDGMIGYAMMNIVLSVLAGMAAAYVGTLAGRAL